MKTEQITEMSSTGCNLIEELLLRQFIPNGLFFLPLNEKLIFPQEFLGLRTCVMLHQFLCCKVSVQKTNNKQYRNKIFSRDHPQSLECLQLQQLNVCPSVCLKQHIDKGILTDLASTCSQQQQTAGERMGSSVLITNPISVSQIHT